MIRLKVCVSMDLCGCRKEDEIEVEDDATEEEIEAQVSEWAHESIEWWHERIAPENDPASAEQKLAGQRNNQGKPTPNSCLQGGLE